MLFAFTEEQLELRAAVRRVLERECTTADLRALADAPDDVTAGRSPERWAVLSELGVPGALVPEAHGGLGLSEVDLVGVIEEAGRAALPEPLAETAALAGPLLSGTVDLVTAIGGGPERPGKLGTWLRALAGGELVVTVGGVEPTAGAPAVTTRPADGGPDGIVVTPRVAGAGRAGLFLLARTAADGTAEIHAVEAGAARVQATPALDLTADVGSLSWAPTDATLLLDGTPARERLGDLADRGALATAAALVGLADTMITMGADYARQRVQFGRPIGSFQADKHLLADARVKLEFARPALYRAAWSIATLQPERSHDASMAKAMAADAAELAARVSLQVHGAIGYTWECDLQLFMKRAWWLSSACGDAPTHRARVLAAALAAPTR